MVTMNTIMVVLDGGDGDEIAVAHAVELATGLGASIELFACVYNEVIAAERAFKSADLDAAKLALIEQRLRELDDIAKPLVKDDNPVTTSVVWDKPAYKGVVRRALVLNPTLVVRHRHFHGSTKRAVFSNDDWNLIRTCPAPLLLTRKRPWTHASPRIWAAVDPVNEHDKPGALDDIIVRTARSVSTALKGTLDIVHLYDSSYALADVAMRTLGSTVLSGQDIAQRVKTHHAAAMDDLVARCELNPKHVRLMAGSARQLLPGVMIDAEADMLVLGVVARGRLARAVVGNTAE